MRVPLIAFGLLIALGAVLWLTGFFGGATPPAPPAVAEAPVAPAPAPAAVPEAVPEPAPAPVAEPVASAVATSLRPQQRPAAPAPAPVQTSGTLTPAQRLDRLRYFDLREMAGYLKCPLTGSTLPADAADTTYCGGRITTLDPRDPTTGLPYAYTRINDTQFRFCTRLDDAGAFNVRSARLLGFDPATGCLTANIR